ncbi:12-oxophytodienoate reductase, partial [Globisporangium splendens]
MSTGNNLMDYTLFTPLRLADDLVLKNRVVFSPLTRARVGPTRTPNDLNALYYEQRAGAGLIISEATAISEQGYGWHCAPALYNDEQAEAWRKVVERVHARGGKIFLQLWHMGRQVHPSLNTKGDVVSASATRVEKGFTKNIRNERVRFEMARALGTDEVSEIVEMYHKCAQRAKQVGFDGVEVHGANGYLVDQFLQSSTNLRTDKYGGSFENRARFLLEIVDAVKTVWPTHRIGVRLSPNGVYGDMGSADNAEMFTYVMEQLRPIGLAYLAILDGAFDGAETVTDKSRLVTAFDAKRAFQGTVIANNSYTRDTAEGALRSGSADLVGFGRLFISNPDLVERFVNDWPLNTPVHVKYWWDGTHGAEGYTTPPAYDPMAAHDDAPQDEAKTSEGDLLSWIGRDSSD